MLEVLRDGFNGLTVDFFAHKALANRIESALEQTDEMQALRKRRARQQSSNLI